MGDNLPAIDLGTGRTATVIVAAWNQTCALLDNGRLKCWGGNEYGQLGLGDTAPRGDQANEMGDNLPAVDLGTGRTATAVDAGWGHTCAIVDSGVTKCWGWNDYGQLGLGDSESRGNTAGEMGDNLPVVNFGAGRTATKVSAGLSYTCGLLDNATLKCWGRNVEGQLGLGDSESRGNTAGEMGDNLPVVNFGTGVGVSGTVTETGSAAPVGGAWVALLRTSDFSIAASAVANGAGRYIIEASPGSYYLYLIDPTGDHVAGFFGAPTMVTVTAGIMVDADPAMASTRGAIAGSVVEEGTNTAIPGAFAIMLGGTTGLPEIVATANTSGQFTVPGLRTGTHFVGFIDPTGAHATRFYLNSPNVPDATPLAVTGGGTTLANGSLPTQTVTQTGAALTGRINEMSSGEVFPGVIVMALHAANYQLARAGVTNASGRYNLNVAAGSYKLAFIDPSGLHNMEWHDSLPADGIANAASVTAPAQTNATLDSNTGGIYGTITDDPSGTPIPGAWVLAIGPTGVVRGAIVDGDGNYRLAGLPAGTYRAAIVDPHGGRSTEYWDNNADYAGATVFAVNRNDTTVIDADLTRP